MAENRDTNEAQSKGWQVTGDPDRWILLAKAFNPKTGEYHSTKVLELADGTAVIQCDHRSDTGQFTRSMVHVSAPPVVYAQRPVSSDLG